MILLYLVLFLCPSFLLVSSSLSASTMCHLSLFDLGLALRHRLTSFTAYSHGLGHIHAEKASNLSIVEHRRDVTVDAPPLMPPKGILRNSNTTSNAASSAYHNRVRSNVPTVTISARPTQHDATDAQHEVVSVEKKEARLKRNGAASNKR